jgi:hypothetical protein
VPFARRGGARLTKSSDDVVDIGDWRRLVGTAIERLVRDFWLFLLNLSVRNTLMQVVSLGKECIDHISGPHVTFIDPRLHDSSGAIVRQAKRMIIRFEEAGVDRSQVVFSVSPPSHLSHTPMRLIALLDPGNGKRSTGCETTGNRVYTDQLDPCFGTNPRGGVR